MDKIAGSINFGLAGFNFVRMGMEIADGIEFWWTRLIAAVICLCIGIVCVLSGRAKVNTKVNRKYVQNEKDLRSQYQSGFEKKYALCGRTQER